MELEVPGTFGTASVAGGKVRSIERNRTRIHLQPAVVGTPTLVQAADRALG